MAAFPANSSSLPAADPAGLQSYSMDRVAPELRPQLEHAAITISSGINADVCAIYKFCASKQSLQLVAGTGAGGSAPAVLAVGADPQSMEAHALVTRSTVIAEHLAHDPRFRAPAGDRSPVASGLAVVIEGETGPFGVCSVYSRRPRTFSASDIEIVEEVSFALTELFRSARLMRDRARFAAVAMSVNEAVVELTLDGRI